MTARKLKKLLYERPYLADDVFVLSNAEAEYLLKKYGYPDMEAIVAKARAKSSLPNETWEPVMAELEARRQTCAKRGRGVSAVWAHKKLVVAALIVLLLAGFFGFVPAGRAMAKELAGYFVSLFDEGFEVQTAPKELPDIEDNTVFESIDAFEKASGIRAAKLEFSDYKLQSVIAYNDASGLTLSSVYNSAYGGRVSVAQVFSRGECVEYGDKNSERQWSTAYLGDGTQADYFVDAVDGSYNAVAAYNESMLLIYANKNVDFVNVLTGIE